MTHEQNRELFDEISKLATEQRNPRTEEIDLASTAEILALISKEDALIHKAVKAELPYIEHAVDLIVHAFKNGGRLIYAGAGTSGRLGVLDASECPPTFGAVPEMVQGIIAGGFKSLSQSQEGFEDEESGSVKQLKKLNLSKNDVVCGISASKRTPFAVGAVKYAKTVGAKTLYLTCVPRKNLTVEVDVAICPAVGPEPIMGSTRMKSGTAQKMVLNMLTTAAFIKMGKVYKNMMIDLQMTNKKLVERSRRIVMMITGVDYDTADKNLTETNGHVKTALVMILGDVDLQTAQKTLKDCDGFVRAAIAKLNKTNEF